MRRSQNGVEIAEAAEVCLILKLCWLSWGRRCSIVGLCNVFGLFTSVYSLVNNQFHIVGCTENSCYNWSLKSFRCCWHTLYFFISSYFRGCWNRKGKTFETRQLGEIVLKSYSLNPENISSSFFTHYARWMFNQAWPLIYCLWHELQNLELLHKSMYAVVQEFVKIFIWSKNISFLPSESHKNVENLTCYSFSVFLSSRFCVHAIFTVWRLTNKEATTELCFVVKHTGTKIAGSGGTRKKCKHEK